VTDGGKFTGLKGRINLLGGGAYPRDLFTWLDSNPAKTMASKGEYGSGDAGTVYGTANRPQWDASDIATGVDNQGTGLYNRVPANGVFDWYLGVLPNSARSSNWTEQLSARQHAFHVPIQVGPAGTPVSQMSSFETGSITPAAVAGNSCADQSFAVNGLLADDRITQVTPPAPLRNLSLNGYAASGAVVLHFCNPTNAADTPPRGSYAFFAVR